MTFPSKPYLDSKFHLKDFFLFSRYRKEQNSFSFIANRLKSSNNSFGWKNFSVITLSVETKQRRMLSVIEKLNQTVHNIQLSSIYWRDNRSMFVLDMRSVITFICYLTVLSCTLKNSTTNWFPLRGLILFINRN